MLLTVFAFMVALGLLIAVHEWGHYRVAWRWRAGVALFHRVRQDPRWCAQNQPASAPEHRVRDRRHSVWRLRQDAGRARRAGGRARHQAFNTSRWPGARPPSLPPARTNLLLAVLLHALVNWIGVQEPQCAVLSSRWWIVRRQGPACRAASWCARRFAGEELRQWPRSRSLRWVLARAARWTAGRGAGVAAADGPARADLPLSNDAPDPDAQLFRASAFGAAQSRRWAR